jgi:hypothetical protein
MFGAACSAPEYRRPRYFHDFLANDNSFLANLPETKKAAEAAFFISYENVMSAG